ncbi:MAG: methionyl-tRNA formyltransferase [Chloroflexota bacterium]
MALRTVFFGTPEFAVPALRGLAEDPAFDLRLVVSQPDRPAGRGGRLAAPPVAIAAASLGLPLYQPASLRTAEARQPLADAGADLFVVAAFGLIFGRKTLDLPRFGCVNLHGSLLPAYRGASPIQTAIAMGERETGVTLMVMDVGLDTGDMISSVRVPVGPADTSETLAAALAEAGAALAVRDLPHFVAGLLPPMPQPGGATITRMLRKEDGWIDWNRPAAEIEREVRAFWPWPRCWTTLDGRLLQVHRASVLVADAGEAGQVIARKGVLAVRCGDGALILDVVQPAGRPAMPGSALAASVAPGTVLGRTGDPGPRPPLVVLADEGGDRA